MQEKTTESLRFILASASPRRRELLQLCQIPFSVEEAHVDENRILEQSIKNSFKPTQEEKIIEGVLALASAKAVEVAKRQNMASCVIGADTIVLLDGEILGKPSSKEEAKGMLSSLVGKKHQVITCVALSHPGGMEQMVSTTDVYFHDAQNETDALIDKYIDTLSPMDKAGAYGIQDMGALFIRKIDGDYYTVMGLPISILWRKLMEIIA